MPPPFLDPDSLDDLNFSNPLKSLSQSSSNTSPLLVLSPSSLSHQPEILESLLSSIPAGQAHDLQMLDRIALDFAPLPPSTYSEAILALPPTEEKRGELENAYSELKNVFDKIINTLRPGGRLRIGQPQEYVRSDAVLAGFLVEQDGEQVSSSPPSFLTFPDCASKTRIYNSGTTSSKTQIIKETKEAIRFPFTRLVRYNRRIHPP
jgi:Fe-S cluster assembly protein DRE2 N-terminus